MDVQVKSYPINDHTVGPWNQRNNVHAVYILCFTEADKVDNIQLSGVYNKTRKTSCEVANLSEEQGFWFCFS